MKNTVNLGLMMFGFCFAASCSQDSNVLTHAEFSRTHGAVINGTKVTGNNRLSTVALTISKNNEVFYCSGTLVMPDYVLTAGHCIADCDGTSTIADIRDNMVISVGQNVDSPKAKYHPKKFYLHPDFVCSDTEIKNDIAIIELTENVPSDIAQPSLIVPTSLQPSAIEIDIEPKIQAVSVGFGLTNALNPNSVGVKYETTRQVLAVCSLTNYTAFSTSMCDSIEKETERPANGFVYFYDSQTNVCHGDSGGSTFIVRGGREYLLAVTSWVNTDASGHCLDFSAMTFIEDYRKFITSVIKDFPAAEPEICDNGIDDNGDKRYDCEDPYCSNTEICQGEICYNGIDDDGDYMADCEDSDCSEYVKCLPEICDNGMDENDDGLVDCDDPQCASFKRCIPEDCRNGMDDNDDGLVDCDDPQCEGAIACVPEDCTNQIDDNEDGRTDCDDPQCSSGEFCVPEDCSNGVDDNNNNLVDCDDGQCSDAINCQPEDCGNGADDNGNGLEDCRDPECFGVGSCPEIPEKCSNGVDDNGDGRIDCDDVSCSCALAQVSDIKTSASCASAPVDPSSNGGWAMVLAILAGLLGLRRRKI